MDEVLIFIMRKPFVSLFVFVYAKGTRYLFCSGCISLIFLAFQIGEVVL